MRKTSWRHHYLPVFYLKGFTNENNKFLIFDKEQNRFIKNGKEFSPNSYFFEKNSNTWFKDGEGDDVLETKFFGSYDDTISKLFDKIHSSNLENRFSVSEKDMPMLQNFVNLMYWRLPHRKNELEEYLKKEKLIGFGLSVHNKDGTNTEKIKEIEKRIENNSEFKKSLGFLKSLIDTVKMVECRTPLTIQPFMEGLPHVCSDNPVLFENTNKPEIYKDDFVFPMSGNMFFIRSKRSKGFSLLFKLLVDTLVYKQAVKYVSFTDERYYHSLNEFYEKHFSSIDSLRSKIFKYLKDNDT